MAPRLVPWRGHENRVSPNPPISSETAVSISIIAIDSISAPQNPLSMSQATPEALAIQPGGPEADPTAPSGINPTTDADSFPRHDTYFFRDGNITFLVRKCSTVCTRLADKVAGRWYAVLRSPILFLARLGLFLHQVYSARRPRSRSSAPRRILGRGRPQGF